LKRCDMMNREELETYLGIITANFRAAAIVHDREHMRTLYREISVVQAELVNMP